MSNEQNGHGIDPLVSDTYRELAEEKTPEALNREVLRLAAREARTRYAISRAWTRPLAWAATIGLSLVLVLQLADVPQPVAGSSEPPDAARQDQGPVDSLDVTAPGPLAPVSQPASMPPEQGRREAADEGVAEPALEKRSRIEMQQDQKVGVMNDLPVAAPEAAEVGAVAEEEPPARSYLSRDATQAKREKARVEEALDPDTQHEVANRERSAAEQPAVAETSTARSMASFSATAAADDGELLCPENARETAEKWLECIVAIEQSAPPELVDREYRALHQRFPELGEVSR